MSRSDEPLLLATTDSGAYDAGGRVRVQGPGTGLTWGAEMVRLNSLRAAEHHDELRLSYVGCSEFGVGLCQGTAEGYRQAARDLIRYAGWQE